MGKKLAIKGHPTRGMEVVKLLEMLGGYNGACVIGNKSDYVYFITDSGNIGCRDINYISYDYFTLEEFLEKYPYKVGDLKDRAVDSISCIIDKMRWNSKKECVEYHGSFGANDYGWHRAEDFRIYDPLPNIFSQKFKTDEISFNEKVCKPEVELKLGNYEIEVRDGKTYAVLKKSKYPTTYEECCEVLGIGGYFEPEIRNATTEECHIFMKLIKIKRCRDAYWKIAGEEIGLGKPWEPNWTTFEGMPAIFRFRYNIVCDYVKHQHCLLVFPIKEIRNTFYENFKDLIEQCKELL